MLNKFRLLLLMTLAVTLITTSCNKDDDDDTLAPPVVRIPLHVYGNYFYVNWIGVVGANAYMVDVATDQEFNNILTDYNNKEVAINGMFVVDNLNINTSYYVRMRAHYSDGNSGNSAVQQFETPASDMLPNGNMEEWITYPNYENPFPEGIWASANKIVDLNPSYYHAVLFKSDDAHSGNFAAKGVTARFDGLPLLTGSVSTGLFDVDLQNPLESMIIGVPYKSYPTRFQGYYKYFGVNGDSCEIRTTLTKWDLVAREQIKVGEAIMRTTDLVDEYTFFDLEFEYFSTEEPDTIDMVFAASAGGEIFVGGVGSTIYVDDFDLKFD